MLSIWTSLQLCCLAKSQVALMAIVDQDQTAQNMDSDLWSTFSSFLRNFDIDSILIALIQVLFFD